MAAARGPLTLRDFLELACDSSSDGFRSYPRCLPSSGADDAIHLVVEADDLLRRSPSRSPSSSFFRSPGPGALARISSLSRSFSRRIFWRRRENDDDLYADLDDRDSCGFPSPLVSSCSASDSSSDSEYDAESEADHVIAVGDKTASTSASECEKPTPSSSSSSSAADHHCTDGVPGDAAGDGNEAGKLGREEDKHQQLSPVSVLDFPFDDDDRSDAGTCSPSFSFQRCCPTTTPPDLLLHSRTTTTKQAQLRHRIRRYDGVAEAIHPVDLEARFTATSDSGESLDTSTHLATTSSCTGTTSTSATTATSPACHGHQSVERPSSQDHEEPDEYRLLERLLQDDTAAAEAVVDDEVSQVLLLDFFAEGIDRLRCSSTAAGSVDGHRDSNKQALLVGAAAEWLRGAGPQWGIRDVMLSGKAALEDMERGRRWMSVAEEEEEREVGEEVEGLVMEGLVDELVAELGRRPWWHNHGRRWRCH